MTNEILLDEMCRHCNNYFNPQNNPTNPREYPPAFLGLAVKIEKFISETEKSNTVSAKVNVASETVNLEYSAWTVMFSKELALYKRLKVI